MGPGNHPEITVTVTTVTTEIVFVARADNHTWYSRFGVMQHLRHSDLSTMNFGT
jgi:hypothetical protein